MSSLPGGEVAPFGIPGVGLAWFLMALFVARVAFNFLLGLFEQRKVPEGARLLVVVVIMCAARVLGNYIMLPFALEQGCVALFFLYVGYVMHSYNLTSYLRRPVVVIVAGAAWVVELYLGTFFSIGNMFFAGSFTGGLVMTLAASAVVIRLCMLVADKMAKLGKLTSGLCFVGANSLLVLCLHQVELDYVNWVAVDFPTLGPLSMVLAGCLHLALVAALTWLVVLNPLVRQKT